MSQSRLTVLAGLILLFGYDCPVRADYYGSFYYAGSARPQPIISLDLDPQRSLDSAFRVAAREERLEDLERFYHLGAHVDSSAEDGVTALMYAARNCELPIVRFLVSVRTDFNQEDHEGRTPLIYAVQESCLSVVDILLRQPRINWRHRDKRSESALDYARDMAVADVGGPASAVLNRLLTLSDRFGTH